MSASRRPSVAPRGGESPRARRGAVARSEPSSRGDAAPPRRAATTAATPRRGVSKRGSPRASGHEPDGAPRPVGVAVLTVSDTRRGAEDRSGARAQALIERAGHRVIARAWCRDDVAAIRRAARAALSKRTCDALVVTGGTGLAPRDVTPEAFAPLFDRALPGFGERFRAASVEQIGAAAWLSRAEAGVARGRLVVLLPGSTRAVELALTKLLLPELAHAVRLLGRFD